MTTLPKTLFSILLICFSATASQAASSRMSLLTVAEIFGDVILLSNLLNAEPLSAREPPREVVTAASPQVGMSCPIGEPALAANREKARSATNIASHISAKRMERLVTREEVFEAIQSVVGTPQNSSPRFHPQDIQLGPAVWVSVDEPRLVVTQIKVDPLTGCTWFRLRATAAPHLLPFYAALCAVRFIEKKSLLPQIAFARLTYEPHPLADPSPFLVEPGHPARLLVSSPDSQMILIVHPLQRGRLGETVRVRLEGSVKTLTGQVTGLAHLDQTY